MQSVHIVGLGNKGKLYSNTPHNVGMDFINFLLGKERFSYKKIKKTDTYTTILGNVKLTIIQLDSYMNLSGEALATYLNFYNISMQDVIVIHDDLDMEFAKLRYKEKSSHGGHNGIKDIFLHCGKDFPRVKIGIGRPNHNNVSAYVLAKLSKDKQEELLYLYEKMYYNLSSLIAKDFITFINNVNI